MKLVFPFYDMYIYWLRKISFLWKDIPNKEFLELIQLQKNSLALVWEPNFRFRIKGLILTK